MYVQLPKCTHQCPVCKKETSKIHDYRIQKINHLKWFERLTILFYKLRRYVCNCGERFSEKSPFVDKYQRYSKEWNQVVSIRAIKAKTFKTWQVEILNSFSFGYSNDFLEGITNKTKVMKRNAYGFRRFDH